MEYNLEEATMLKADTVEELAVKMGVNKEAFVETINSYNDAVQDWRLQPGVKDDRNCQFITPNKTNWALKFNEGPFLRLSCHLRDHIYFRCN